MKITKLNWNRTIALPVNDTQNEKKYLKCD